jgi:hypothetical protein
MVNSVGFARKRLSMAVRQIILPCARICFLSAPFYGSSAGSMMREEMKLYLIENTLVTHLEDETSQTKIRA